MGLNNSLIRCHVCGQGGMDTKINYKPPKYNTFLYNKAEDTYCSKCGENLYTKCSRCNGTGIDRDIFKNRDNYCSHCGRSIEYNDTCQECNGDGEVYDSKHNIFCQKLYF